MAGVAINVVQLFDGAVGPGVDPTADWDVLDGESFRVPVIDPNETPGTKGGSATHAHAGSGIITWQNSSGDRELKDRSFGSSPEKANGSSSHGHSGSGGAWSIPASASNIMDSYVLYAREGSDATIICGFLKYGTIVFTDQTTLRLWQGDPPYQTAALVAATELYGKYLAISGSADDVGAVSGNAINHNHGNSQEIVSGTHKNDDIDDCSVYTGTEYPEEHYHKFCVESGNAELGGKSIGLKPYRVAGNIMWADIPENTIVLFKGSTIPTGWAEVAGADFSIFMTDEPYAITGSWEHTHPLSAKCDSYFGGAVWNVKSGDDGLYAGGKQSYAGNDNEHSPAFTGSLDSADTHPPFVNLRLIKKSAS